MLTSADAKWKCMWYLLVWSVLLTLVSLFLQVHNHVAFYVLAAASVLLLPFFTAIYSNTAGRHGAGLLRTGLVFCDPVLACLAVTPVLLLNHLPVLVDQRHCLLAATSANQTANCTANGTLAQIFGRRASKEAPPSYDKQEILYIKHNELLVIQGAVVIPILLVLLMGRRTRKMTFHVYITVFAYWFVTSVEAGSLLETLLISPAYKHVIYTTEAITCIAMIGSNSYAIVTLCSYVNPRGLIDQKHAKTKFPFVYIVFMCVTGILFAEIPMLVARFQVLASGALLPGSFYLWLIKDIIFIVLIAVLAYVQRFGHKYLRIPCKPTLDNKHVFFQPEKRDKYINEYRRNLYLQSLKPAMCSSDSDSDDSTSLPKCKSVPNIPACDRNEHLSTARSLSKSTTHLDKLHSSYKDKDSRNFLDKFIQTSVFKQYGAKKKTPTANAGKVKKQKRVSFKLELGKGKFIEMKARSDSPPVIHDGDSSNV